MFKQKNVLVAALLFFFVFPIANAQRSISEIKADTTLTKKERRKLVKEEKIRDGKWMITPVFGPGYTPELGFTIAGGALTSFRTDKSDTLLQRSSLPVTIGISTTGAYFVSGKLSSFWLHDKIRAYSDVWFKNMPDNYFGIGYENGKDTEKSDSTTKYTRTWIQFYPKVFWQIKKNFFLGGMIDLNYTKGKDACGVVESDPAYMEYNNKPFNTGLGLSFQYDSRDFAVNAYKGMFAEVAASFYGSYLGGDNVYQVYSVDLRDYIRLFKEGQLLALQVKGRFAVGDVPYGEMSQLGTPFDLRGYYWGQYRDKSMLFFIGEYRHKFYKSNGKPSIHGMVAWVAGGSIGGSVSDLTNFLPNAGIGYRLEVQPRMNVRLDFGVGQKAYGFYFNFNEAF